MASNLLGKLGLFHCTLASSHSNRGLTASTSAQIPLAERTSWIASMQAGLCSRSTRFLYSGRLECSNARKHNKLPSSERGRSACPKGSLVAWHNIHHCNITKLENVSLSPATRFLHSSSTHELQSGREAGDGLCTDPSVSGRMRRRFHCNCSSTSSSMGLHLIEKAVKDGATLVVQDRTSTLFSECNRSNVQLPSLRSSVRLNRQVLHALLQDLGGCCHEETAFPSSLQLQGHGVRAAAGRATQIPHGMDLQSSLRRGKSAQPIEARVVEELWQGVANSFALDLSQPDRRYEAFIESNFGTRLARFQRTRSTCYFHKALGTQPSPARPLTSARPRKPIEKDELAHRRTSRQCVPHSRDTPPKRDTGIASEQEWGIDLKNEKTSESGVDAEGGTWYRESGEDLGENGYRCRWTVMGGRSADGSSEWKEAWWEKSDWTGYKELAAEKSGRNAQGDTWWETWQEILRQDDWSNLARIEKSAQKQAKSGSGSAGWYEKWWEKYNAKGWSEKGAHKYGRLNDQGWWEKWGEQYDGRGAVLKWTDKWAETDVGTKWGDKWEEKFDNGAGTRRGETWHYSSNDERWTRTWGEEHFGNGKVHKYGKSTSGESWDNLVEEGTFYQAEPHYGWADAVGNSVQLLAIEALERPPGIYPDLDLGMNQE